MSPIDRFKAACSVTDFAKAPNTTGGYTVWSVTTIVRGGRADIDGPYFTAEEAAISAELLTSIDKFAKPQASTHCSVWNPDPKREKAIRDDAAHPECCWQCSWEPKYQITAPTVRPGVESWPPQQPTTPR